MIFYYVNCRHAAELIRLYRGCLDLVVMGYLSLLVNLVRAWSSLMFLWLILDTLTKLPSSCLPSLTQSRVYRLRAWSILANLKRLLHPLQLLCWLTFTETLSCSIEHVINTLRAWHVTKMLSQLTTPSHCWFATWQPLTETSQPQKMGATDG